MIKFLMSFFTSLFFFGLTKIIFQSWVAAILVGIFVCLFAFFTLYGLSSSQYADNAAAHLIEPTQSRKENHQVAYRMTEINDYSPVLNTK